MQSRILRKLLNDTGYAVHFRDGKICIGSQMCSDLLTVDAKTLEIKYSLDTFREGRKSIKSEALEIIWDKLLELIKSGELKSIIENNDSTAGMFPVYCCDDGEIIERFADAFGWPHSTHDGTLMYENTFFKTEQEAIDYGIKDMGYAIKHHSSRIAELEKEIEKNKFALVKYTDLLNGLKSRSASMPKKSSAP